MTRWSPVLDIDHNVSSYRRIRVPLLIGFAVTTPLAVLVTIWATSHPSDARGLIATEAWAVPLFFISGAVFCWRFADRERYVRFLKRVKEGRGVYHDPSPTRMCPRCGLPMDRLMGGAFYTGPASPLELCHRCLGSDRMGGSELPPEI